MDVLAPDPEFSDFQSCGWGDRACPPLAARANATWQAFPAPCVRRGPIGGGLPSLLHGGGGGGTGAGGRSSARGTWAARQQTRLRMSKSHTDRPIRARELGAD